MNKHSEWIMQKRLMSGKAKATQSFESYMKLLLHKFLLRVKNHLSINECWKTWRHHSGKLWGVTLKLWPLSSTNLVEVSTALNWQSLNDNILHFQPHTRWSGCGPWMLYCQNIITGTPRSILEWLNKRTKPSHLLLHKALCRGGKGKRRKRGKKLFRFFILTFFLLAFRAVN